MKRLFTFGCSFTNYHWPTWADILGKEFEHFENWGRNGAGNQYIFHSLVECKLTRNFTSDDTVVIMWSNITREDRYIKEQNGWVTPGNIVTNSFYSKSYIKKFFCERGYLIRDTSFIAAAIDLLKNWNVNYKLLCMVPISNADQYQNINVDESNHDVLQVYNDSLKEVNKSINEIIFNFDWGTKPTNFLSEKNIDASLVKYPDSEFYQWLSLRKKKIRPDPHACPQEHLEYLEIVLPELKISDETKEWIKNFKLGDTFFKNEIKRL